MIYDWRYDELPGVRCDDAQVVVMQDAAAADFETAVRLLDEAADILRYYSTEDAQDTYQAAQRQLYESMAWFSEWHA